MVSETRTAKLFKNGSSQAVRLPADFRFDAEEVYISRDPVSGNVVLSLQPSAASWDDFIDARRPADCRFMQERPLNNAAAPSRNAGGES